MAAQDASDKDLVCVVDDDDGMRSAVSRLIRCLGVEVRTYASPDEFLQDPRREACGCLVLDVRLPEMSGPQLQSRLAEAGWTAPIIFMTGYAEVKTVVDAMRHGALDFLEKPFSDQQLLDRVREALERNRETRLERARRALFDARLALLTPREKEVLGMLVDGHSSKVIADKLGISPRTVEDHRASILMKLRLRSVVALVAMMSKTGHTTIGDPYVFHRLRNLA
jgi:FixJ family two-component response regulator